MSVQRNGASVHQTENNFNLPRDSQALNLKHLCIKRRRMAYRVERLRPRWQVKCVRERAPQAAHHHTARLPAPQATRIQIRTDMHVRVYWLTGSLVARICLESLSLHEEAEGGWART